MDEPEELFGRKEYEAKGLGEFGELTREASRTALLLCQAIDILSCQMAIAKKSDGNFVYGHGDDNNMSYLAFRHDLEVFCKHLQSVDRLLNGDGQSEHLAAIHTIGDVKWHNQPYGSYAEATLTMARMIYRQFNPQIFTALAPVTVIPRWESIAKGVKTWSAGVEMLRVGLEQEQIAVERKIKGAKPSQNDPTQWTDWSLTKNAKNFAELCDFISERVESAEKPKNPRSKLPENADAMGLMNHLRATFQGMSREDVTQMAVNAANSKYWATRPDIKESEYATLKRYAREGSWYWKPE